MTRSFLPAAVLFLALASPTWATDQGHGRDLDLRSARVEATTNSLCPVTIDEPVDPTIFVEYRGERVSLCCQRCRKQFLADPEAYAMNLPQPAGIGEARPHDHDHDHDHGEPARLTPGQRAVRFAGRFHPIAVHFPIALLVSAALGELLAAKSRGHWPRDTSRALVLLGAPTAVLAAVLGWAAGLDASYPNELAQILVAHRWLGVATAAMALGTLYASERYWRQETARRRWPYLVALSITALLVGITGHFGGTMIFGTEHFTW